MTVSMAHVKSELEDIDVYASCKCNQNADSVIKTEQIEVQSGNNVKTEQEGNMMLTVNQSHETVNESISKYHVHGWGPSRSATRNVDNDCETTTDSNEDGSLKDDILCWKYGELESKPPSVEGKSRAMEMDNQLESDLINHNQSGDPSASVKAKLFRCNICSERFIRCSDLNIHIRTVHNTNKIRTFSCPHCPYKASSSGHLREHILTHAHTGEKKLIDKNTIRTFSCPHCPYKASSSGNLKAHILSYSCPHCPYKAPCSGHLTEHILTHGHLTEHILTHVHTREKKFIDKKFIDKNKIRAFACPHCPHKASSSGNLKEHILSYLHTGEKNFKCDICDKKFVRNTSLTRHNKTVHAKIRACANFSEHIHTHSEKNFKCDICDKKFTQSWKLRQHYIETMHDKIEEIVEFI